MKRILILLLLALLTTQANAQSRQDILTNDTLFRRIESLDGEVFSAFNRCDLKKFSSFFTQDVEFYQDTEGVTWSRRRLIKDIKKYICGKVRRELIPATLEVYPIKGFGAVEIGDHRFCELATGKCEGVAKFIHIWQNKSDVWTITRVISYDHRAAPTTMQRQNESLPAWPVDVLGTNSPKSPINLTARHLVGARRESRCGGEDGYAAQPHHNVLRRLGGRGRHIRGDKIFRTQDRPVGHALRGHTFGSDNVCIDRLAIDPDGIRRLLLSGAESHEGWPADRIAQRIIPKTFTAPRSLTKTGTPCWL